MLKGRCVHMIKKKRREISRNDTILLSYICWTDFDNKESDKCYCDDYDRWN